MTDGGVYYQGNKNCNFIMNMLEKHKDLINVLAKALQELTSVRISKRIIKDDGYSRQPQLRIETPNHPYFTKIRERLYINGYKSISSHYLKMMDAEALAIMYMCDGSVRKYKTKNPSYDVTLNLKRLSEGDTLLLKHYLKLKFDLEFNLQHQNQYFYLRLRCKDVQKFMDIITPHIVPSFNYKLIRTIDSDKVGR